MKKKMYGIGIVAALFFLGAVFAACSPRMDDQRKMEAIFIKQLNKTAKKLALSTEQTAAFDTLKTQIHQNFQAGRDKRQDIMTAIKKEGAQQKPDITRMTTLFQGYLSDEAQRINTTFDLMLGFNNKLTEPQKEKLTTMITDWVGRWR
jgi:hypothetical protein